MRIHSGPTVNETLQGKTHYNIDTDVWDIKNLLEVIFHLWLKLQISISLIAGKNLIFTSSEFH